MSCEGSAAGGEGCPCGPGLLEKEVMVQHFLPALLLGSLYHFAWTWTHTQGLADVYPLAIFFLLVPWLGLSLDPLDPITVRSSTPSLPATGRDLPCPVSSELSFLPLQCQCGCVQPGKTPNRDEQLYFASRISNLSCMCMLRGLHAMPSWWISAPTLTSALSSSLSSPQCCHLQPHSADALARASHFSVLSPQVLSSQLPPTVMWLVGLSFSHVLFNLF